MRRVVESIMQNHDLGLIALACLVCILATTTSARLLVPHRANEGGRRALPTGAAVIAFSTGVWTAHFLSTLAYRPGVPFSFDVPLCAVSLLLAMVATALAFLPDFEVGNAAVTAAIRGTILATGIGAMHFSGMRALLVPGIFHYQLGLAIASLGLGVLCTTLAMWLVSRRRPGFAAVLLTLAVAFVHFVAMKSTILECIDGLTVPPLVISKAALVLVTSGTSILLLLMALAASALDQHHTNRLANEARRLRTLADATFEGLIFATDGRVVDVNRAMCQLAGSGASTLIGLRLVDLIPGLVLTPRAPNHSAEYLVLLPDGQTRPVEVLWRDYSGNGGHVVAVRDLSRQKEAELCIERLARFDPLTGLANRAQFDQRLQQALALSDRSGSGVAVLYVDLDRFETIGAAMGARAVEDILTQTARRLTGTVRETDTVARLERDEFAIIQLLTEQTSDAAALADRIVEEMALPFTLEDNLLELTASVGIAMYRVDGDNAADLSRQATLALRQAKQDGRGRWRYFEPGMDLLLRAKRSLESDLRKALQEGQLSLNYQPFLTIEPQALAGYEALLRWDHPDRGRISPADFIPLAEECGLIVPIGIWVLDTACAEAVSWDDPVIISVNLSPAQFIQPGIVAAVADVLQRTGLPPARLELEITEGTLMQDTQNALRILTALKALGVKIAMDDFGTGYSSLSYLRKFPFDKIKIDRSFISDIDDNIEAETIVEAIMAMCRSLRLAVTAEGVETNRQLDMLRAHGCTFAQGYLLGRPSPADQIGQRTAKDRRAGAFSRVASSAAAAPSV